MGSGFDTRARTVGHSSSIMIHSKTCKLQVDAASSGGYFGVRVVSLHRHPG